MNEELKPCEHCGALSGILINSDTRKYADYLYKAICAACKIQTPWCFTQKQAIEKWNTRV